MRIFLICIAIFLTQQANAAVTISISEQGGNVQAVLSGSINLAATQGYGNDSPGFNGYQASSGNVSFTANISSYYGMNTNWTPFGTGGFGTWDTSSGDAWHMFSDPVLGLPVGYVSGDPLSATAVKNGATFASLGFVPGTYVTTLTSDGGSDTVTVLVASSADLSISVLAAPEPAIAGDSQPLVYTVTVTNSGPSDAINVVVDGTLPAGVSNPVTSGCVEDPAGTPTCSLGDITAGASANYTVSVDVDADTLGSIDHQVQVSSDTPDSNPENDSALVSTQVIGSADLSISKIGSSEAVIAGGSTVLTYTIAVNNAGPSDAVDVNVNDILPPLTTLESTSGCNEDPNGVPDCGLGTIIPGGSAQYTIDVTLARADSVITNVAEVSSLTDDPDPSNNVATADTELSAIAIPVNANWALILMVLLLGGFGWTVIRRN